MQTYGFYIIFNPYQNNRQTIEWYRNWRAFWIDIWRPCKINFPVCQMVCMRATRVYVAHSQQESENTTVLNAAAPEKERKCVYSELGTYVHLSKHTLKWASERVSERVCGQAERHVSSVPPIHICILFPIQPHQSILQNRTKCFANFICTATATLLHQQANSIQLHGMEYTHLSSVKHTQTFVVFNITVERSAFRCFCLLYATLATHQAHSSAMYVFAK